MNQRINGATLVFIFVSVLLDVLLSLAISAGRGLPNGAETIIFGGMIGFAIGQSLFAFIWSGLVGNSWIRSYSQVVIVLIVTHFLIVAAMAIGTGGPSGWIEPLFTLMFTPLIVIIGSLPLWATRYLLGWRIVSTTHQATEDEARSVGVEDILLLTATVASALMLTRASIVIGSSVGEVANLAWQSFLIGVMIFGVIVAPLTFASVWLFFGSRSWEARFVKMSALGLVTWILLVVIAMMFVVGGGGAAGDAIVVSMFLILAGFGTLFFGLTCLIADGQNLLRRGRKDPASAKDLNQKAPAVADPFAADVAIEDAEPVTVPPTRRRRQDRLCVGALVASAVFFTMIGHFKESRVREFERAKDESISSLRGQAIDVVVASTDDVRYFRGKPTVSDSIAIELEKYPGLKVVDLTGCKGITDLGATQIARLPSLDRLLLAGTSVSDNLFDSLIPGEFALKELDLSNTQVTVAGIKKIFGQVLSVKLSLRGLNLNDEDLKQLESLPCTQWDLRDNPISKVPMRSRALVLGKNSISLQELSDTAGGLQSLKIDGMKLADDEFIEFLSRLSSIQHLSLSNTQLTDKSLDPIFSLSGLESLEIGPGNFTGTLVLPTSMKLRKLKISNPQMNLGLLATLGPPLQTLDLSGSGVTDAELVSIQSLMFASYNLDQTQVTIKGLKHLLKLNPREVSLRGTAITPADFEQEKSLGAVFTRLVVDDRVFTDQAKRKIKQRLPIQFEESLMFEFVEGYQNR